MTATEELVDPYDDTVETVEVVSHHVVNGLRVTLDMDHTLGAGFLHVDDDETGARWTWNDVQDFEL